MKYICHRGWHDKFIIENTILAFDTAIKKNYNGIELDIRQTKDHKIIVHHDATLPNNHQLISQTKYKKIFNQNLKIPLLQSVLSRYQNIIILIEVKDATISIMRLIRLLNKYANCNKIYLTSFNENYLYNFLNKKIKFKIGPINYIFNSKNNLKYNFILINKYLLSNNLLKKMINNNLEPFVWGITNLDFSKINPVYYERLSLVVDNKIIEKI